MVCVCGTKLCKLKMVSDILDHPVYTCIQRNETINKHGFALEFVC